MTANTRPPRSPARTDINQAWIGLIPLPPPNPYPPGGYNPENPLAHLEACLISFGFAGCWLAAVQGLYVHAFTSPFIILVDATTPLQHH